MVLAVRLSTLASAHRPVVTSCLVPRQRVVCAQASAADGVTRGEVNYITRGESEVGNCRTGCSRSPVGVSRDSRVLQLSALQSQWVGLGLWRVPVWAQETAGVAPRITNSPSCVHRWKLLHEYLFGIQEKNLSQKHPSQTSSSHLLVQNGTEGRR